MCFMGRSSKHGFFTDGRAYKYKYMKYEYKYTRKCTNINIIYISIRVSNISAALAFCKTIVTSKHFPKQISISIFMIYLCINHVNHGLVTIPSRRQPQPRSVTTCLFGSSSHSRNRTIEIQCAILSYHPLNEAILFYTVIPLYS